MKFDGECRIVAAAPLAPGAVVVTPEAGFANKRLVDERMKHSEGLSMYDKTGGGTVLFGVKSQGYFPAVLALRLLSQFAKRRHHHFDAHFGGCSAARLADEADSKVRLVSAVGYTRNLPPKWDAWDFRGISS